MGSHKIRPVEIAVTRLEGRTDQCGKPRTVKDPTGTRDLYLEASGILNGWGFDTRRGGYDKCRFEITFEDGEKYVGRYDLYHPSEEFADLRKHVYEFQAYYAGIFRPAWMNDEQWEQALVMNEPYKQKALDFLAKYEVEPARYGD